MKDRIILLGPPASGKGTQAAMLSERLQIPAVSTGALLRKERARGTALGSEADFWARRGMLFPDEVAMRVVNGWLHGRWAAFILDGFPRTVGQAVALDAELAAHGFAVDIVLHLLLPESEIRRRVRDRISCTACGATFSASLDRVVEGDRCPACSARLVRRNDDQPNALERRLAQYREHINSVVQHYRQRDIVTEVDATGDSQAVFEALCARIEEEVVT